MWLKKLLTRLATGGVRRTVMMTDSSYSDTAREPELHYPFKPQTQTIPWHNRVLIWGGAIALLGLGASSVSRQFFLQRNLTP